MKSNVKSTPLKQFTEHYHRWKACTACDLWKCRKNVVLARGDIPCQVCFVGEAPGDVEDVQSLPFLGPAGTLLDQIISEAVPRVMSVCLTNLVCCMPKINGVEGRSKVGEKDEPADEEIKACRVRLVEFLEIAQPKLLVAVGALARDYLEQGYQYSIPWPESVVKKVDILHPAAILRFPAAHKPLAVRRCVVTVANAIAEVFNEVAKKS